MGFWKWFVGKPDETQVRIVYDPQWESWNVEYYEDPILGWWVQKKFRTRDNANAQELATEWAQNFLEEKKHPRNYTIS